MALTLSKLCKDSERLHELKLVAGRGGLENTVRWVHMIEDTEVPDFLHGNELVFTTGIANYQKNWMLYFVKHLKKNNAAGVVLNIGPYIKEIPPQVIVYCEQNDFPIFTIPWETRIIDITYEFCRIIINDEKIEQSLTEAFKNLIMKPEVKEGYAETLEKSGFSNSSKYTVLSICFKENSHVVTSKFTSENESLISQVLKTNSQQKVMFVWKKNLNLIYQNLSNVNLEKLTDNIQSFTDKYENINCYIGISQTASSFEMISESFNQAQSASLVSEVQRKPKLRYADLGVYKLLLDIKNTQILKSYYIEVLGNLLRYDKEHNSDLCSTLKKYCYFNGGINEMAEELGVHRNTINYKMKKIKEILQRELDYGAITDIVLCFKISDIIN